MYRSDFMYASSRLRALEPMLLDSTDVERMLGAKDAQEAYKILNDTAYATHVGDIDDVHSFQQVVTGGLKDSKELLERICPDPRLLDILFLRYDFHNIKSILKGMAHDKDRAAFEAQLLPLGRIPNEVLLNFFLDKDRPYLPVEEEYAEAIKAAVADAKAMSEKHDNDPRIMDLVLDKHMMNLVMNIAGKLKNRFILDFIKTSVDISNLKTFMRIKLLGQEDYFVERNLQGQLFVDGGHLAVKRLLAGLEKSSDGVANLFRGSNYYEFVVSGLESFEKTKTFATLEGLADDYMMNLAKSSRYTYSGPEVVVAYFYAKQNNAQIIRMIMIGKLAGLADDVIRERLNELYN